MDVHVFSRPSIRDDFSDILPVFDDGVSHLKIPECDLMPQRYCLAGRDMQRVTVVQSRPYRDMTRIDINDGDADVVTSVMNQELSHLSSQGIPGPRADLRESSAVWLTFSPLTPAVGIRANTQPSLYSASPIAGGCELFPNAGALPTPCPFWLFGLCWKVLGGSGNIISYILKWGRQASSRQDDLRPQNTLMAHNQAYDQVVSGKGAWGPLSATEPYQLKISVDRSVARANRQGAPSQFPHLRIDNHLIALTSSHHFDSLVDFRQGESVRNDLFGIHHAPLKQPNRIFHGQRVC